jgi:IPT/TIG domain
MKTLLGLTLLFSFAVLPSQAQTQNGNLWVDGKSGNCTRSSSPAAYNSASACKSMQAAQTAASGGDTVVVQNGSYPAQTLASGAKTTTVNYVAQTVGSVLLAGLQINIDKVHITGIVGSGTGTNRGGLDIEDLTNTAFTDVVVNCGNNMASWSGLGWKNVFAAGSHITLQACDFGNWDACDGYNGSGCNANSNCAIEDATRFWSWGSGSTIQPDSDIMLGNIIHDVTAPPDGACGSGPGVPHTDALQVYSGGTNITIQGNKFYGNASSALQSGGGTLSNWTIQNNYFGATECCNNLVWGQATVSGSFIVRNNTNANPNGYLVVNNIDASGSATIDFSSNLTIATPTVCTAAGSPSGGYNIFPSSGGATCGSNVKRCNPTFLNGVPSASNGYDIRISTSDTCAVDAGNPSDYATTDMYGTTRPQGSAPDAGAYELPSGATQKPNPPTGLTGVPH